MNQRTYSEMEVIFMVVCSLDDSTPNIVTEILADGFYCKQLSNNEGLRFITKCMHVK